MRIRIMSFPVPNLAGKARKIRANDFNVSLREFSWNKLSDKEVIGGGSFLGLLFQQHTMLNPLSACLKCGWWVTGDIEIYGNNFD